MFCLVVVLGNWARYAIKGSEYERNCRVTGSGEIRVIRPIPKGHVIVIEFYSSTSGVSGPCNELVESGYQWDVMTEDAEYIDLRFGEECCFAEIVHKNFIWPNRSNLEVYQCVKKEVNDGYATDKGYKLCAVLGHHKRTGRAITVVFKKNRPAGVRVGDKQLKKYLHVIDHRRDISGKREHSILDYLGPTWVVRCLLFTKNDAEINDKAQEVYVPRSYSDSLNAAVAVVNFLGVYGGYDNVFKETSSKNIKESDLRKLQHSFINELDMFESDIWVDYSVIERVIPKSRFGKVYV